MQRRQVLLYALSLCCVPSTVRGQIEQVSGIKMVKNGDVELATESLGAPELGTIVLIMGATASMVWWPDSLVRRLAEAGYQVIRFDHRDTGRSSTFKPGELSYDVADLASDVWAILDAYRVDAAHLVGMSLGGYLAQIIALAQPHRVRSLTLIAAEPLGMSYPDEGMDARLIEQFNALGDLNWSDTDQVKNFLLAIAELSSGTATSFDRAATLTRIARELVRTNSIQSAFNHALLSGGFAPQLKASDIGQPTLVIHGSDDPVVRVQAAHVTAGAIVGSRLMILQGRGHELLEQDVPAIASAIIDQCLHAATNG